MVYVRQSMLFRLSPRLAPTAIHAMRVYQTLAHIKGHPGTDERAYSWDTGVGFLLQADSTLTDTQRAAAALPVCCKCAGVMAELRGASHSSSSRRFDRLAAPALLPPGLVDAVVAQLASRCHEPTEHLRSEHTRCSDAGGHRGAVGAHLDERRSCARSWRQPSSQVLHPPAVSIPQLSEHVCCEISAVLRSFDTGQSQSHTA